MKRLAAMLGALALFGVGSVPAIASTPASIQRQLVVDGSGVAFSLRPTYDAGGANPLHFYIGYAEANISSPEPAADGQASWYNFGIAETAAFKPPDDCIPRRNPDQNKNGTPDAVEDVQAYISSYVAQSVARARSGGAPPPPLVPSVSGLCAERLPGFAQSRYPSTVTIAQSTTDNYFDKPSAASACRDDPASTQCGSYKQYWPMFRNASGRFLRDGAFRATATDVPSQASESLLMGAGDGAAVSIGLARTSSSARIENGVLIVESTATLHDICIVPLANGCTLAIDTMRQFARLRKDQSGHVVRDANTTVLGVHGSGVSRDITADDLKAKQASIDLGGYFQIQGVSQTHSCDPGIDDPSMSVADAGGIKLFGKGGSGGGIMIGGACARARLDVQEFVIPSFNLPPGFAGSAPSTYTLPRSSGGPPLGHALTPGAPRVTTDTVTHTVLEQAIAWRTAPYWVSTLAALLLLMTFGYILRARPVLAPVVRVVDRFARQFLRG